MSHILEQKLRNSDKKKYKIANYAKINTKLRKNFNPHITKLGDKLQNIGHKRLDLQQKY